MLTIAHDAAANTSFCGKTNRSAEALRHHQELLDRYPTCKGLVRVIAVIKDPIIIHRILKHLHLLTASPSIAPARSPPTLPFDDHRV